MRESERAENISELEYSKCRRIQQINLRKSDSTKWRKWCRFIDFIFRAFIVVQSFNRTNIQNGARSNLYPCHRIYLQRFCRAAVFFFMLRFCRALSLNGFEFVCWCNFKEHPSWCKLEYLPRIHATTASNEQIKNKDNKKKKHTHQTNPSQKRQISIKETSTKQKKICKSDCIVESSKWNAQTWMNGNGMYMIRTFNSEWYRFCAICSIIPKRLGDEEKDTIHWRYIFRHRCNRKMFEFRHSLTLPSPFGIVCPTKQIETLEEQ